MATQTPVDEVFGAKNQVTHDRRFHQEPLPRRVRRARAVGVGATLLTAIATEAVMVDWAVPSDTWPIAPWAGVEWSIPAETWEVAPYVAVGAAAVAASGLFLSLGGQIKRGVKQAIAVHYSRVRRANQRKRRTDPS